MASEESKLQKYAQCQSGVLYIDNAEPSLITALAYQLMRDETLRAGQRFEPEAHITNNRQFQKYIKRVKSHFGEITHADPITLVDLKEFVKLPAMRFRDYTFKVAIMDNSGRFRTMHTYTRDTMRNKQVKPKEGDSALKFVSYRDHIFPTVDNSFERSSRTRTCKRWCTVHTMINEFRLQFPTRRE